eukprot:3285517-Prymnesium_polylepis.2
MRALRRRARGVDVLPDALPEGALPRRLRSRRLPHKRGQGSTMGRTKQREGSELSWLVANLVPRTRRQHDRALPRRRALPGAHSTGQCAQRTNRQHGSAHEHTHAMWHGC